MADQHDNTAAVSDEEAAAAAAAPADEPAPETPDDPSGSTDEPGEESEAPEIDDEVALSEDAAGEAPEPDYQDQYLRAVAELDNVRKRARRDVGAAEARGIAKLAKELLPAIDDLDRALAHAEAQEGDTEHHLTSGIRLVQQQLLASLQKIGIEPDSPKGQPFDPHRHEAIAQQPAPDGVTAGTVLEVYSPGYVYADSVLRAAKVVVAA